MFVELESSVFALNDISLDHLVDYLREFLSWHVDGSSCFCYIYGHGPIASPVFLIKTPGITDYIERDTHLGARQQSFGEYFHENLVLDWCRFLRNQ